MLDFFIIGAQKSASTYLHHCVASHPEVYMPREELRFFEDPDFHDGIQSEIGKIISRGAGRKVGIKRPDSLAREEVPQRIHQFAPQARLIAILRNPVDRAISAYYHQMKLGFLPILPLNEGMRLILEDKMKQTSPKATEILKYGLYYKHLKRYLRYFSKEQLLVLVDQDVRQSPEQCLHKVFTHIGVSPAVKVPPQKGTSNPGVYSHARLSFINLRNNHVFEYNESRTRLYRRPGLWAPFVNTLIVGFDRLLLARLFTNERPLLDDQLKQALRKYYLHDVKQLEILLNRDLAFWLTD
jgi:hypothetical protein